MRKPSKYECRDRNGKTVRFTIKKGSYPKTKKPYWRVTGTVRKKPVDKKFPSRWGAEHFIEVFERTEAAAKIKQNLVTSQLTQAQINDATAALDKLPSGASLVEAVDFYLQHQTSEEKCVRDAFKALIERKTKENKRPRTISEYKTILNPFVKKEGLRLVSEISKKSVESYIEKPKNSIITYQNRLRIFSSFFNFCAREGWLVENPTKSLPRKQYDPEEIVFLSLKEAKEVVKATKSKDWLPLLPYICCCMFCGLRPSEAERIDWSSISLKQGEAFITVKASGAKKRRRRIVEIPKNAQNLLALASKDSFRPRNFKRKIQLFRKSLSFEWSNNILRHSYGTYHFALHSNENLTASNMGNSPDILHEHYRALTTKSEGKKYFSIC